MRARNQVIIIGLFIAGFILLPITNTLAQTEKILSFHSDIEIHDDGSMRVTETIRVICAGREIRRGIFRTFPTRYKDRYGNTIRVLFEVEEVLKDGESEPYHIEKMVNGVKVYAGQSDVFLRHGEYTYTLVYRTDRQIGFFDDYDELYWNVTGLDWAFVIDQVDAVVRLPAGAEPINTIAYTGPQGARGQDYTIETDASGRVRFTTTSPLLPEEGLTIAVSFTKGIIPEPTVQEKLGFMLKDNASTMTAIIGFGVLLLYYFIVWARIGKDPAKGTIIPRFHPPKGYSPAATRYVMRMGYSNRVFAAAIINMAVKNYVTIHEHKGKYTLSRTPGNESVLTSGERKIAKNLFGTSLEIVFRQTNHQRISKAINALKMSLKTDFEKMHFRRNGSYTIPGFIITLITFVAVVLNAPVREGALFMSIWLAFWTVGCSVLVISTLSAWKSVFSGRKLESGQGALVAFLTIFTLPFLGAELFGLWMFSSMISSITVLLLLALVFLNIIYYHLLKAPTIHGRKVMDEIEGFKMYLEVAEEERLDMLHPPEKTPELFEKYLPYALALGVENDWSEKFADVLEAASVDTGYSPSWYTGTNWKTAGITGVVSSLGSSFSSAISSSSSAPGSSSGSSGGGSSGGGGGGGGGGGW